MTTLAGYKAHSQATRLHFWYFEINRITFNLMQVHFIRYKPLLCINGWNAIFRKCICINLSQDITIIMHQGISICIIFVLHKRHMKWISNNLHLIFELCFHSIPIWKANIFQAIPFDFSTPMDFARKTTTWKIWMN